MVSGVVGDQLHISIRNVGYVKSAGDVTRAAPSATSASAGGHRTMAKAVVPVAELAEGADDRRAGPRACQERIVQRFLRALDQHGKA